jgi:hypothetical protein
MAVRALREDVVEKRLLDPVTVGLLIHVAYLLHTLA